MNIVLIILNLILTSCSAGPVKPVNMTIRPGEVRWIEFPVAKDKSKLLCRGQEIKITRNGNKAQAVVIESYFSDLSPFQCKVEADGTETYAIAFSVEEREYKSELLKVSPKKIKLSPKDEKRAFEEQQVLNKIYASSAPELQFKNPFMHPMQSVVTSVYGTRRVYNKSKKGQHLGIDYRAAIGDKVPAANAGKVVFADDLFYTGWTVIIDHGLDIYTVYGHLSQTLVKASETVAQGQIIGLSGNTGRSSGPHLHWGVKVQGQYIDGFVLIDETKKYFHE